MTVAATAKPAIVTLKNAVFYKLKIRNVKFKKAAPTRR